MLASNIDNSWVEAEMARMAMVIVGYRRVGLALVCDGFDDSLPHTLENVFERHRLVDRRSQSNRVDEVTDDGINFRLAYMGL